MGNEISTIGGGAVTVGAALLAGATLGQVQTLNNAMVSSASYTAEHAKNTVVRHVGEAAVMATATAGASVASAVTLGQVQTFNDAVMSCASYTAQAGGRAGGELLTVADGMTDNIPVVGHVKGGICYAVGANERGSRAMKGATRSIGVITGGIGGAIVGGPAGAIAGGVAGGATMDGVITGASSVKHGEFRPHGQIASWNQVANAKSSEELIDGIVGVVMRPVVDGFAGYGAGSAVDGIQQVGDASASTVDFNLDNLEPDLSPDSPGDDGQDVLSVGNGVLYVTAAFIDIEGDPSKANAVKGADLTIDAAYLKRLAERSGDVSIFRDISPRNVRRIYATDGRRYTRHANLSYVAPMPGFHGGPVAAGVIDLTVSREALP